MKVDLSVPKKVSKGYALVVRTGSTYCIRTGYGWKGPDARQGEEALHCSTVRRSNGETRQQLIDAAQKKARQHAAEQGWHISN